MPNLYAWMVASTIEEAPTVSMSGDTSGSGWSEGGPHAFAVQLALCGGLPQRLLDLHVDDGTGRCVLCSAGAQTGHYRHPCNLRILATEALVIQGRVQL